MGPGGGRRGGGGRGASPLPKKVILDLNQNKQKNPKSEKTEKTKIREMFYTDCVVVYEKIKLSYGQYTHSGIRVQPKTRENDSFEKKLLSPKNSSPDSKADFSEKLIFCI